MHLIGSTIAETKIRTCEKWHKHNFLYVYNCLNAGFYVNLQRNKKQGVDFLIYLRVAFSGARMRIKMEVHAFFCFMRGSLKSKMNANHFTPYYFAKANAFRELQFEF